MTRLAPTLPPGLKPTSVALSELAIAAGLAGHSIAVRFQDYPAPVLCGLWQYLACAVESSAVVHARGQADVRRLPENMGHIRRVAPRDGWFREPAESLAASLLTWSAKQVRSHFDRLQRSGYIAAERPRSNGPWLYKLPEELTAYNNPYQQLLTGGSFAGNNTAVD